jgi:hypothetical protein
VAMRRGVYRHSAYRIAHVFGHIDFVARIERQ